MVGNKSTDGVVIIGGGLGGTLLATRLLEAGWTRPISIVDARARLGEGVAYSAKSEVHRVNANAGRMSAYPEDPEHFTRWLQRHHPETAADGPIDDAFVPRRVYAVYARDLLARAEARARPVRHVRATAVDLQTTDHRIAVTIESGERIFGSVAVLATGVFPASKAGPKNPLLLDPWDVAAMRETLDPVAEVAIVGTGLTMVDAVSSLEAAGHRGGMTAFSRHGLLPHPRRLPPAWPDFISEIPPDASPLALLRAVRRECRAALAAGIDWQAPLDTVRAHIAARWSQASERDKRRFVQHPRAFWESHHHRAPPGPSALVRRLRVSGRLKIIAATVEAIDMSGTQSAVVRLRRRGVAQAESMAFDRVVNSGGIQYDWRRVEAALPRNLLRHGLVRPGPLGLGIDANAENAVLDRLGQPTPGLFALGPPLRGLWWESTAVVDVALQAEALAARLAHAALTERRFAPA